MPAIQTRVSHFLRLSQRRGDAYVRTISPDLSEKTQQRTGLILGVLKADAAGPVGDALIANIEDALIRGLNEAQRRLLAAAGQEAVFEAAMTKVNESLARVIGERRLAVRLDQVCGIVLAQKGVDVIAAAWGDPALLLFHPTKDGKIKVYDLLEEETPGTEAGAKPAGRGYMHLITGRVNCGDKLFVCTEDLRSTLGPAELAPIITDNDPEAATAILGEVFAARKATGPLALFVTDATECEPGEETAEGRPAKRLSSATQRSIEKLLSTESQTRSIMSPAIIPSLLRNIGGAMSAGLKTAASSLRQKPTEDSAAETDAAEADRAEPPAAEAPEPADAADGAATPDGSVFVDAPPEDLAAAEAAEPPHGETEEGMEEMAPPEPEPEPEPEPPADEPAVPPETAAAKEPKQPPAALLAAARMARNAGSALKKAALTLASKEQRQAVWPDMKSRADAGMTGLIGRFNALPPVSRYILLAILAVVLIFNYSLTFAGWQRQREETVAAYDRNTAAIRQKIDSAEASLIYRDEARARELLREAEAMIAAMPERRPEQKAVKDALTKKVSSKYETIRREVRLGAPEVAASITTSQEAPVLIRLAAAGDAVWAASDKGEVFRIALKDGTAAKAGDAPGGDLKIFLSNDDVILAGDAGGKLSSIRSGSATAKTVDLGNTEAIIADGDLFNGRLYLLDPTHNRILRLEPTSKGFGQPQFYLKDGTDVSSAVSLSIDGLVYVLLGDGSVVRLMKGTRDPFAVGPVDPAIKAPVRIRSWADSERLYVLDGAPVRLISYDKKTGALAAQYVSEALQGAADFLVNEKDRVLLVAVGNDLLRFALPEMK